MSDDAQDVTEETSVDETVDETTPVEADEASQDADAPEAGADEPTEAAAEEAPEAATDEAPEATTDDAAEATADEATESAAEDTVETPGDDQSAIGPVRVARVYVCERGHRTTTLWGEPTVCQANPTRTGPECGLPLYHITELPEQVQKALNPLKASKKASKKG